VHVGICIKFPVLRIMSSGMLRRVALVRTYVPEELSASFIRVTRIGELGTTLAVTSNRRTLRRNTKCGVPGRYCVQLQPTCPDVLMLLMQSLHWADGPFRGHQVKGASTAHKTRISGQVGRS
jgi:hypothetical protein